jgi:hypothetical protein
MHIADLVAHAHKFHNEAILLTHFSPRCAGCLRLLHARRAGAGGRARPVCLAPPPGPPRARPPARAAKHSPPHPHPSGIRAPTSLPRWRPTCRRRCGQSASPSSTASRERARAARPSPWLPRQPAPRAAARAKVLRTLPRRPRACGRAPSWARAAPARVPALLLRTRPPRRGENRADALAGAGRAGAGTGGRSLTGGRAASAGA